MSNSIVIRPVGQTTYVSVSGTSSTAATITVLGNDQANYAAFLNTGANPCAVNIAPSSAGAAVYPSTGAGNFVLPAAMNYPVILSVPSSPFSVTAICATGKTTDLFITPVDNQS